MSLARVPEVEIVMESASSVEAFDAAGSPGGPLFPIYHFNATRLADLVPEGGTVVDLFCGSGRLLRHLLSGRPDLRVVGVDLSARMLDLARAELEAAALADRAVLVRADGALADEAVGGRVDAVVCLSALHHCRGLDDLLAVLGAVRRLRERDGGAVWLFDLVRPEDEALVELIPRAHEVSAQQELPPAFRDDWVSSLRAGWTFVELSEAVVDAGLDLVGAEASHSQLHWAGPVGRAELAPVPWIGSPPATGDLDRAETLAVGLGW